MKTGHLINSVIAVCLIFIVGNQFLQAGSLTPPAATVAPTMKSLEQIFEQQRFAAFAGNNVVGGPGLITSTVPTGTGTFLGVRFTSCGSARTAGRLCKLSIQNLGDCDVQLVATGNPNGGVAQTHTITVPSGQSYAGTRFTNTIGTLANLNQAGEADGFGTYTFLGGTDCQFMWVVR